MEALDWFKKLYDDGLIASDWAIRDTGTWRDDNNDGVAGAYCDCTDNVETESGITMNKMGLRVLWMRVRLLPCR